MKNTFILFLLVSGFFSYSQTLNTLDTLDFGVAFENAANTKMLEVVNTGNYSIEITDVDLFEIYGEEAFTTDDTAFVLFPNDTAKINISFLPEHNIYHEMILVIKTKSGFGHRAVVLKGQGRYSNTYYNSLENKSEEALKVAIKARLAQGYSQLSYNVARDNMYGTIDNNGGDVECVYTGRIATFNTRPGANSNSFNTEHTFPQGFFSQNLPMRSDIHHLYPTDVTSNSRRGNDPFGIVTGSPVWQNGGSKSGNGTFEPRNLQKGTTARAMMYFVLRYQDYSNHFSGQEGILRQWHNMYPPSVGDSARNSAVAALQNNRNPFIDYPQLEERITKFVANSTASPDTALYFSDDSISLLEDQGRYDYHFVVYNPGNQTLNLSNFLLSDTSLHFSSAMPSSLVLNAHESYTVAISYDASKSYSADLQFTTDYSLFNLVTVPINSGAKVGLNEDIELGMNIYPNPSKGILKIHSPSQKIANVDVLNSTGKVVFSQKETGTTMDLEHLSPGLYFVRLRSTSNTVVIRKWILK